MRKRILYLLLAVGGCGLVVLLIDSCGIMWVGYTDLTVEFAVTDAETGNPIEGAEIAIVSNGGFNEDDSRLRERGLEWEEFALKTDVGGRADYVCRRNRCCGTDSALGLTSTFSVHMPRWSITVKAPGYEVTEPFSLNRSAYQRAVKRTGPRQSEVVVPLALRKAQ